jgi:hypothetical protein
LRNADTPEVTTALLKFMAEFVLNKTQRLTFDSSSPNGILLFREVSRVICTYGSRVLAAPPPGEPYGAVSWLPLWLVPCMLLLWNVSIRELLGNPPVEASPLWPLSPSHDVCLLCHPMSHLYCPLAPPSAIRTAEVQGHLGVPGHPHPRPGRQLRQLWRV